MQVYRELGAGDPILFHQFKIVSDEIESLKVQLEQINKQLMKLTEDVFLKCQD